MKFAMLARVVIPKLLLTFTVLSVRGMTLEAEEQARIVWKNIGPGGGGWLPCVAVSPHDSKLVYAGCDVGGFFKSTDGGGTWRICNTGLRGYYVECILPHPHDPSRLIAGTAGNGVFVGVVNPATAGIGD